MISDAAPRTDEPRLERRVLIIDDNEDAANATAMLIDDMGGEARVAYDGQNALALIDAYQPEVVLLDIGMRGLDGYATCQRIRRALGPPGGLSRKARHLLVDYHWLGTSANSGTSLERAAILCDGGLITAEHLALNVSSPPLPSPTSRLLNHPTRGKGVERLSLRKVLQGGTPTIEFRQPC